MTSTFKEQVNSHRSTSRRSIVQWPPALKLYQKNLRLQLCVFCLLNRDGTVQDLIDMARFKGYIASTLSPRGSFVELRPPKQSSKASAKLICETLLYKSVEFLSIL